MPEPFALIDRLAGNEPISYEFYQPIKEARPEGRTLLESFQISKNRGQFVIRARHALGARYGIALLEIAKESGHLGEYLERREPRFRLRPLWLEGKCSLAIGAGVSLDLPAMVGELSSVAEGKKLSEEVAKRLFELGYNALLLGKVGIPSIGGEMGETRPLEGIVSFLAGLRLSGIQVILKPRWQSAFSLEGMQGWLAADPLFFEGQMPSLSDQRLKKGQTSYDLILSEVRELEGALGKSPLIYYCQTSEETAKRQSQLLGRLVDDVKLGTILAFSAKGGDPREENGPLHPLFHDLRLSPDESSTELLPIVNAGSLKSGEGLLAPLDHLQQRGDRQTALPPLVCWHDLPDGSDSREDGAARLLFMGCWAADVAGERPGTFGRNLVFGPKERVSLCPGQSPILTPKRSDAPLLDAERADPARDLAQ